MFRIKICGVTRREDAFAAAQAGADAIGLNFFNESPRFVNTLKARAISWFNPPDIMRVGVYVNAHDELIWQTSSRFRLQAVQLHGDEAPDAIAKLRDPLIIRARRMDDRGVAAMAEDLDACRVAGRLPDAVLVDAMTPGRYGGTGESVSWAGLADYRRWLGNIPLILAGGLNPENVAEAIRIVRPYGVDVASGVESSPGVKDHEKMLRFIEAARAAFAAVP